MSQPHTPGGFEAEHGGFEAGRGGFEAGRGGSEAGRPAIDAGLALAYIECELSAAQEALLLESLDVAQRCRLDAMRQDRAVMRAEEAPAAPFDLTESVLAAVERQELFGATAPSAELPAWSAPATRTAERGPWRIAALSLAASVALLAFAGAAWVFLRPAPVRPASGSGTAVAVAAPTARAQLRAQSLALMPALPALPPAPATVAQPERESMLDFVVVIDAATNEEAEQALAAAVAGLGSAAVVSNFAPAELRAIERVASPEVAALDAAFEEHSGSGRMDTDVPLARPVVGSDADAAQVETRVLLASEGATHTLSVDRRDLSAAMGAIARADGARIEDRGADAEVWAIPDHARIDVPVFVRLRPRG